MDELINQISSQIGVSPDKAKIALDLVINHLKAKAPALSSQLDGLVGGESAGGGLGDVAGKLGGMLGGGD